MTTSSNSRNRGRRRWLVNNPDSMPIDQYDRDAGARRLDDRSVNLLIAGQM